MITKAGAGVNESNHLDVNELKEVHLSYRNQLGWAKVNTRSLTASHHERTNA